MRRKLVIVRGYPGSGRTTLATALGGAGRVLSIENFYQTSDENQGDVYLSDAFALATAELLSELAQAVEDGNELIVVDIPGVRLFELRDIAAPARSLGYNVTVEEPRTAWSRDPAECSKRTRYPQSTEAWRWMIENWEDDPTLQRLDTCESPTQRLETAKWIAAMGAYDPAKNRYLLQNYPAEAAELTRLGFLGLADSRARREQWVAAMNLKGKQPPTFETLPAPTIDRVMEQLQQTLRHQAEKSRTDLPSFS